jgi:2-oxoglutarate ferredoxin oxidoreductase subunit gamma
MQSEVMFAGFGGQGIMTIGKMLAEAGLEAGREVSWIPSYGPEMRGGTAYCLVVLADRPIGSPIISNPAHLVAMNRPSLEKFAPLMRKKGVCVVNSSLIPVGAGRDDVAEIRVACNEIAIEIGNSRTASIIALGAFCAASGVLPFELVREAVADTFKAKPAAAELNLRALAKGAEVAIAALKKR